MEARVGAVPEQLSAPTFPAARSSVPVVSAGGEEGAAASWVF